MTPRALSSRTRTVVNSVRVNGFRHTAGLVARRLDPRSTHSRGNPVQVSSEMALRVDWTKARFPHVHAPVRDRPARVAWLTSPPSLGSGGHQNMWRFMSMLEAAGHHNTVYLWDWRGSESDPVALRRMLESVGAYPKLKAEYKQYDESVGIGEGFDALIATAWETAYPAWLDPSPARRMYFVQDFEPSFFATGTNSVLAENTYRLGFHGITAGPWLAHKLAQDYGMPTAHYDFALDHKLYHLTNEGPRPGIFFYARPSTPRRGFELGLTVLAEVARQRPDIEIHLAGEELAAGVVPFPHTSHGLLALSELNALYNRCSAALVLSLTNLSLLPLELLAAGATPVLNEGPNNLLSEPNPRIVYTPPSPQVMAHKLIEIADDPQFAQRAQANAESVASLTWELAGKQFVREVERVLHG